jgi:hypothetical protein
MPLVTVRLGEYGNLAYLRPSTILDYLCSPRTGLYLPGCTTLVGCGIRHGARQTSRTKATAGPWRKPLKNSTAA